MSFDTEALAKQINASTSSASGAKSKRRHTIGYKGILKEISNNNGDATNKDKDNKKIKRRVSFAPEVTLHKISFIPPPVSSLSSFSSSSGNSDIENDENNESGHNGAPSGKGNDENDNSNNGNVHDDNNDDDKENQEMESEIAAKQRKPLVRENVISNDEIDRDDNIHIDEHGDDIINDVIDQEDENEVHQSPFLNKIIAMETGSGDAEAANHNVVNSFNDYNESNDSFSTSFVDNMELTEIKISDIFKQAKDGSGRKTLNIDEAELIRTNATEPSESRLPKVNLLDSIGNDEQDAIEETMEITESFKRIAKPISSRNSPEKDEKVSSPLSSQLENNNINKFSEEADGTDEEMTKEVTMEMTNTIRLQNQRRVSMQPPPINTSRYNELNQDKDSDKEMTEETTMEFTKPFKISGASEDASSVPKYAASNKVNEDNEDDEEEATMELTKPIKISALHPVSNNNIKLQNNGYTSGGGGNDDNDDDDNDNEATKEITMDITKSFFLQQQQQQKLALPKPPSSGNGINEQSEQEDEDEHSMELTKPVANVKRILPSVDPVQFQNVSMINKFIRNRVQMSEGRTEESPDGEKEDEEEYDDDQEPEESTMQLTKPINGAILTAKQTVAETPDTTNEISGTVDAAPQIMHSNEGDERILSEDAELEEANQTIMPGDTPVDEADRTIRPEINATLDNQRGQEGKRILNNDKDQTIPDYSAKLSEDDEEEEEDSDIYPDEKTISNTIANSMLGQSAPITSSPIKDDGSEDNDNNKHEHIELDGKQQKQQQDLFTSPERVNSPIKLNFGSSPVDDSQDNDDGRLSCSPQRQREILGKANERKLPSPSQLNTSPLRKALAEDRNNRESSPVRTSSIPKLPALNFKDQQILKSGIPGKRKRLSLPAMPSLDLDNPIQKRRKSDKSEGRSSKRKTIGFGTLETRVIGTIQEEDSRINDSIGSAADGNDAETTHLDNPFIEPPNSNNLEQISEDENVEDLVEDSQIDDNYEPATIEKFLEEINLKFFDDMVHSTIMSTSLLPPQGKEVKEPTQLDYGKSNEQLSTLELLTYGCKELKKYIKEGQLFFNQLSQEIAEENPATMKEFFTSDTEVKSSMIEQFHISKNYAKLEAQYDWYSWKKQLIDDIVDIIEKRLEDLNSDKKILDKKLNEFENLNSKLVRKSQEIEKRLHQLKFQNDFLKKNNTAKDELLKLRKELVNVTEDLMKNQKILENHQYQANSIVQQIENETRQIAAIQEELSKSKKEYEVSNSLESKEIIKLQNKVEGLIKQIGLKLIKIDSTTNVITLRLLLNSYDETALLGPALSGKLSRRSSVRKSIALSNVFANSARDEEEKNNNVEVSFDYNNLSAVDSFKFEFGKNFKLNEKIYDADINNCRNLNATLIEFFKHSFTECCSKEDSARNFTNVLDVLQFFRKAIKGFETTFIQLYFLTIKSRAKIKLTEDGRLLVNLKVGKGFSREIVKMELTVDFIDDILDDNNAANASSMTLTNDSSEVSVNA